MGKRMGKAERIEIEDFVQNIVERMETPEAFEKMISREGRMRSAGAGEPSEGCAEERMAGGRKGRAHLSDY